MEKDFVNNVLISLKRTYEKDEVVSALYKKIENKEFLIGQLTSEIDYLNNEIKNYINNKEISRESKKEIKKEELYKNQKAIIKSQNEIIEKLKKDNANILLELIKSKHKV